MALYTVKRLALIFLLVTLLAGCAIEEPTPVVVTATSPPVTATPEPTATNVPATPTQEVAEFRVVNSNPYFFGEHSCELPTSDSQRYQVVGRHYECTARYPVWASVTVPPYINREPYLDGSGRAILRLEFHQIQGEWGIKTVQDFEGGTCYYIKQTGRLDAGTEGDMRNLSLGARIIYANESSVELRLQSFPLRRGPYQIFWIVRPVQDTTAEVEIYTYAVHPEFSGDSVYNEIEAFEIMEAHDSQCPEDATTPF